MSVHSGLALTDSIVSALTTAGLLVGDAQAPTTAGWQAAPGSSVFLGYVVVYELAGGTLDGPLADPDIDASVLYQLTAVGATRQQAEWIADKARTTILAGVTAPTGRKVIRSTVDMLGGTTRDDDVQPPVFYSPDRYRIWTVPT